MMAHFINSSFGIMFMVSLFPGFAALLLWRERESRCFSWFVIDALATAWLIFAVFVVRGG